jgi:tetratricopeptide (TPR) repeat protein
LATLKGLVNFPLAFQPGAAAPHAEHAVALAYWAESAGGCGLVEVENALKQVLTLGVETGPTRGRLVNVPARNDFFTGREEILSRLHDALKTEGRAAIKQAISGLGGIGKTATAIEYAHRHREAYSRVLWTNAESESALTAGFAGFAPHLGLPFLEKTDEQAAAVKGWLTQNRDWLLILDNADAPEIVTRFLPSRLTGAVLLTSRATNFDALTLATATELDVLTPDEAAAFFSKRTKRALVDAEAVAAGELARELGHLPLALEQAAAYVRKNQTSFVKYLDLYRARRVATLKKSPLAENASNKDVAIFNLDQRTKNEPSIIIPRVANNRMPTSGDFLIGREAELLQLNQSWKNPQTNILTIVAWGGTGKSALINRWRAEMANRRWDGAENVFEWTFYSQGLRNSEASDATFIDKALRFFKDPFPETGSEWDKGTRLAKLIAKSRTLLFLDGLEPLQFSNKAQFGRLKAPGIQALLQSLAENSKGLCVITTRYPVGNLSDYKFGVEVLNLKNLSREDGAALLQGIIGKTATQRVFVEASKAYDGHALSLNLLGTFIRDYFEGDIVRCLKIFDEEAKTSFVEAKLLDADESYKAERILRAYRQKLENEAERALLYVVGLFDRMASCEEIDCLRTCPLIGGLTEVLTNLTITEWNHLVGKLRRSSLIAPRDENDPEGIDAHPLVREYFGRLLREDNPEAWRLAHGRLSDFWLSRAELEPKTLQEMTPLYIGVAHGCSAGSYEKSLDVYRKRILRSDMFSTRKLGAIGSDFAALYGFFEKPFSEVTSGLPSPDDKIFVLRQTGYCLRSQGRLREAIDCLRKVLELDQENANWTAGAVDAGILSQIYLTDGKLGMAVQYGRMAVELSEKGNDPYDSFKQRTALAYMKHQKGSADTAADFDKAEQIRIKLDFSQTPESRITEFLALFHAGDFLLGQNKIDETVALLEAALSRSDVTERGRLAFGLVKLILGQAYFASPQNKFYDLNKAHVTLHEAVDLIRGANRDDCLPLILLARAKYFIEINAFEEAWVDLQESERTIARGNLTLYATDLNLVNARYNLKRFSSIGDNNFLGQARQNLIKAEKLIKRTEYNRRIPERDMLADLISQAKT